MKIYTPASSEVRDLIAELVDKSYPDIASLTTSFDLLFVETTGDGPALSCRGCPAYAVIRIVGSRERAKGAKDVEICIDKFHYANLADRTQRALLDHELFHLEPKTDKTGAFAVDQNRRPKFKMRKHDREFGWFDEIARRHGIHSIEVLQAKKIIADTAELYFPFMRDLDRAAPLMLHAPKEGISPPRRRRKAA